MSWVAVNHGQHISIATIHCGLVSLGVTYKKLHATAAQCDEITRAQWLADITSRFTAQQLVFADESSKDNWTSFRHYGRAPTGERACEVRSFNRGICHSILPTLSLDGFLTIHVVRGSVDGEEFYDWVIKDLVRPCCGWRGRMMPLTCRDTSVAKDEPIPRSQQHPHH